MPKDFRACKRMTAAFLEDNFTGYLRCMIVIYRFCIDFRLTLYYAIIIKQNIQAKLIFYKDILLIIKLFYLNLIGGKEK